MLNLDVLNIEFNCSDTAIFRYNDEAASLWLLPPPVLRKMILSGLEVGVRDAEMAEAAEFVLERLNTLDHSDMASRLTLSSAPGYVTPQHINDLPVTIIDVFDGCSLTQVGKLHTSLFMCLLVTKE